MSRKIKPEPISHSQETTEIPGILIAYFKKN